ncbi:MAG TPA: OmpH family outer membrane protein [Gemmatimonadales bacterium]|nr:OmpH family outer membrane protein [Gemmatimonadales bacterium]
MKSVAVGRAVALILGLVLSAVPLMAQQAPSGAAANRVAFVNMRRILSETPGYAQAESTFVREMAGYRTEFQRLQASLDSAAQAFEQQATLLSPSARTTRRQELQTQQQQLEQRGQELQQRATDRERELLDPIQTRVVGVIERLRAAAGYSMVFDVSAQTNTIVTADQSLDMSDRVIAELKSSNP